LANLIKNVSFEEGVNQVAIWAKNVGARQGQPFEGAEEHAVFVGKALKIGPQYGVTF
jgi:hypothetical protein